MTPEAGQPPWHALTADDVLSRLETSAEGLTGDEAARRLGEHGPNAVDTGGEVRGWQIVLRQFTSPLIYILLIALVITAWAPSSACRS